MENLESPSDDFIKGGKLFEEDGPSFIACTKARLFANVQFQRGVIDFKQLNIHVADVKRFEYLLPRFHGVFLFNVQSNY
jgi:hypothetical protein